MKLIHLSDLHLGKRVNEFSMIDDQRYILTEILNIIDEEKPDAVIIAGDIYDRSVPSTDAVELFDDFIVSLSERNLKTFIISGNHDSAERIAFGSRIMDISGIHLSPVYNGNIKPIALNDDHGVVNIYMLPFIKPSHVRRYFEDAAIESYTDAVRTAISQMNIDRNVRNILVTHQFVTGAKTSDSEEISVGGSDNVDASVFEPFDYVALGHIHAPQKISRDTIRYCGTPLKYSFSEEKHVKSATIVDMKEKGLVELHTVPLIPKHDMRTIKGTYDKVTSRDFYKDTDTNDYIRVILTDEDDIFDAIGKLRIIYPNIMALEYDNKRTKHNTKITGTQSVESKSPLDLFDEFYEKQNNQPMSDDQREFMRDLIEKIWEGEPCDL